MTLKDKVVLITGSTNGIGRVLAKKCVEAGARIVIHGTNKENAYSLLEELGKENARVILADLKTNPFHNTLIEDSIASFGHLDALINNAALTLRNNIDDLSEELYTSVMNVNITAPLFLSQKAIFHFRKQKTKGVILNIGSINAHCGERALLAYSISKGAMMTMTRNLADFTASEGIRVNQLNVGWTFTENQSLMKQGQGFPADWEKNIPKLYAPRGKLLRPEEISEHALFWISDKSAPANGVVYELEQYPVIGRNLISELDLDRS